MDSKKVPAASRPTGRTPQPPPPVNTSTGASSATKPRSRSSTPTAPTVSALAGSNGSSRQPKTKSNNNNGSPRVGSSGSKPTPDEPATEDEEANGRPGDSSHEDWMRQSEETLVLLDKQVQDAAKRNLKHQTRCATMRDAIAGKEERMDTLKGTYASLNRELVELEALSSGDYDSDTLEEMFRSIPADERAIAITNAE